MVSNYDRNYVARHFERFETGAEGSAKSLDSLWRIASHVDLFDDLDCAGSLTAEQIGKVLAWLDDEGFIVE